MPAFKKGERVYMLSSNTNGYTYKNVKITAVKKQSVKNYKGQLYNVKIIGTKTQRQNVPEFVLSERKPVNGELEGGRRRTRRRQRR